MKKLMCLTLVCILAACATPLLAVADDATLLRADGRGVIDGVESMACIDDTLYVISYDQAIYSLDINGAGDWVRYDLPEHLLISDGRLYYDPYALVADAGELYIVLVENRYEDGMRGVRGASLYKVTLEGGAVALSDELKLDWDAMLIIGDNSEYSAGHGNSFIQDGKLCFTSYGNMGTRPVIYDLRTGEAETRDLQNFLGLCPYKSGSVIVMTSAPGRFDLWVMDLDTGDLAPLAEIEQDSYRIPAGLVYDEKADALYYIKSGEIFMYSLATRQKPVSVAAITLNNTVSLPVITEDGHYIAASYTNIVKRNIDPSKRAQTRLTVAQTYGSAMEDAYHVFTAKHPDVEVVRKDNMGDIITSMVNRSSDIDIYTINVSEAEYDAILKRGYMAPLTGSEAATALAASVYPNLAKPLTRDGEVVALPLRLESYSMYINKKALAGIGLTEDDVPRSMPELFDLIARLPELLEGVTEYDAFEPHYMVSRLREELLSTLFMHYMTYISDMDARAMRFDTQLMRDALEAFERIDFNELGLIEDVDTREGYSFSVSYEPAKILFSTFGTIDATSNSFYYGDVMPLKLGEGASPMIPVELTVAFINPYTQNMDLALEYINTIAENIDEMTLTHMCPDKNTPVRSENFEDTLQASMDELEKSRAQLEAADEEDKAVYEQRVKMWEDHIQEYVDVLGWYATEESIAKYRQYATMFKVTSSIGLAGDNAQAFVETMYQYLAGEINADTMLKNIDKKITMMLMEGN